MFSTTTIEKAQLVVPPAPIGETDITFQLFANISFKSFSEDELSESIIITFCISRLFNYII